MAAPRSTCGPSRRSTLRRRAGSFAGCSISTPTSRPFTPWWPRNRPARPGAAAARHPAAAAHRSVRGDCRATSAEGERFRGEHHGRHAGPPPRGRAGQPLLSFPLPERCDGRPATPGEDRPDRAKAASLHTVAAAGARGARFEACAGAPPTRATRLVALPGIGPWTASYVRMRTLATLTPSRQRPRRGEGPPRARSRMADDLTLAEIVSLGEIVRPCGRTRRCTCGARWGRGAPSPKGPGVKNPRLLIVSPHGRGAHPPTLGREGAVARRAKRSQPGVSTQGALCPAPRPKASPRAPVCPPGW